MSDVTLSINGETASAPAGSTILVAARAAGVYIPTLCSHPDLPPARGREPAAAVFQGDRRIENAGPQGNGSDSPASAVDDDSGLECGLCVVQVEGLSEPVRACITEIESGMSVLTESETLGAARREKLRPVLARHRHACLTCAQQEGCSLSQCSSNVPENERCCPLFGNCELQNLANYVGISDSTPKWIPTDLPVVKDDPLFERDYNLCIGCTRCVRACRDLKGVEALGFVYDEEGLVQVGCLAPSLAESACRFCTACVEVCPTGALVDVALRAGRKREDLVPCVEACPARIDVPGYLRLVAEGRGLEAAAVVREKVPFPGILGRVCFRPCEEVCRRGELDDPLAICALKRYAADREADSPPVPIETPPDTGRTVAIVGAGPAGLTATFYLRKLGHSVRLFEAADEAGGMMRYGVPAFRLPREVLEREIGEILSLGVDFRPGWRLGVDFSLDNLRDDGCDAAFLALGAGLSQRIALQGADHSEVLWGVEFLAEIAGGRVPALKDRVIVIGGGNVAADVALSALRCGAGTVAMVCLESREEMPAGESEVEEVLEEGITLITRWGPHRVIIGGERVTGVELRRCTRVFDEQGCFNPEFCDSFETLEGDQLIMAVGQRRDLSFLEREGSIRTAGGLIVVDRETQETGREAVYAGGDLSSTAGSIIDAVASGRRAAAAIDRALGGGGSIDEALFERDTSGQFIGRVEGFASLGRAPVPRLDGSAAELGFRETCTGYTGEQARGEAARCLQCDLRLQMEAVPAPPVHWLPLTSEGLERVPRAEGVFRLLDEAGAVLAIKGTADLHGALRDELAGDTGAARFDFEEDKMYSKRESELIQQHLREHGEMPGAGASDLDDLF